MNKTKKLIYNALLLTLLIISGKIVFPLGIISFTLQLIIIFFIAFFCKLKEGLFIIFTYIIFGLLGLPLFANGGGISYIYQPSFGFLIGFIFTIVFIKIFHNIFNNFLKQKYLSCLFSGLIGLLIDYIFGSGYAYIIFTNQHYSFFKVIEVVVLPFLILDILKLIISIFIYLKVENNMNKK